jgi:hypothetical protein
VGQVEVPSIEREEAVQEINVKRNSGATGKYDLVEGGFSL